MFAKIYRLLRLFQSAGGKIEGRKRIQKTIYILQALGYPFQEGYSYYRYGPYSPQVQFELDLINEQNLITVEPVGNTYSYSLNEQGNSFLQKLDQLGLVKEKVDLPAELVTEIVSQDAQFLELASTLMYLLDSHYTPEEAREKIKELKPHLIDKLEDAQNWVELLKSKWGKRDFR